MSFQPDFDACVVGAGAVGLASGYALAKRGLGVVVLEAEAAIGQGASSRNSEVIHAGLYYPTGSLKARFCVDGRRLLYGFLETRGIAHDRCGKLVVATEPGHLARLDAIATQAQANGVELLHRLSGEEARAMEPELQCLAALHSPTSGIFDSHAYMLALQGEIEAAGGAVALRTPMLGATPIDGGFRVRTGGDDPAQFTCGRLVLAAGLGAQAAAASVEGMPRDQIPAGHFGKGRYFRLTGRAPFQRLVYPPPIPGALGMHYRRDLGGQAVFGPDLIYVDTLDYTVELGAAAQFEAEIRSFWPGLPNDALTPDYAGIRPKLHGPGRSSPIFASMAQAFTGLPDLSRCSA